MAVGKAKAVVVEEMNKLFEISEDIATNLVDTKLTWSDEELELPVVEYPDTEA